MVFRLLNRAMVNAYILFCDWQKSIGKDVRNLRQVTFRHKIITKANEKGVQPEFF